jgi:Tol biopolymer transport system component
MDENWDLYTMDADGSNQTNLTNRAVFSVNLAPRESAWSLDGSKIVFSSHRNANWEIYVMDADGSNPTNLTNSPGFDSHPAWHPDVAP